MPKLRVNGINTSTSRVKTRGVNSGVVRAKGVDTSATPKANLTTRGVNTDATKPSTVKTKSIDTRG